MADNDKKVEDAEIVTASNEIVVYVRDTKTKNPVSSEEVIPLNDRDDISILEASKFINEFSASKSADDNALIVTAHLKNGETWSEIYSENNGTNFTPELAIDSLKMTLTTKVWKFLTSVRALAFGSDKKEK